MRRYLDEVLESDSDDEINDDEDDHHNEDGVPVVQEKEAFLPVPGIGGNGNGSGCVREKIVGVVKGLVSGRRTRRALSFPPASFTPPILPAPPITETKTRSNSNSNSNTKSPLTNLALKNNSCTDIPIPIHIHVHEHIGKEKSVLGLETGLERSQSSPPTYTQTKSISLRGRRYAERLGFRRRCSPVGVAAGVSS
ncbi:hypothetical protein BDW59DRAFT_154440 [Aspergillus cavernicola]|uniref:Uncharacterized protein n=1 Tax=Aspergillus cavernicola TaxID=176166 RepID=A0ABR4HFV5_9EURO